MKGIPGKLYYILAWVQKEGEVKAIARLRLKILPYSVREGIILSKVDRSTKCSDTLLEKVREASSAIIGKPCPY